MKKRLCGLVGLSINLIGWLWVSGKDSSDFVFMNNLTSKLAS